MLDMVNLIDFNVIDICRVLNFRIGSKYRLVSSREIFRIF